MTQSGKPAWPSPGAFPFMPFPMPGWPASPPATPTQPDGFDVLKNLWGQLPGSTQVPGFLVPTIDVDEIDKRIADLRAAESWVEVNLNMLRATIQGLEVQRHTIAALRSLSAMPEAPAVASVASPARPEPPPPAEAPPPDDAGPSGIEAAAHGAPAGGSSPGVAADAAASNWLGYLQEQFSRVAQAALSATTAAEAPTAAPAKRAATKRKPAAKRRRRPAAPA